MRLIDADNIFFYCNYEGDCTGDIDDCKECMNYICDFRDIQKQPTAYDVDKVVEKLEEKIADMNFCEYRDAFIDAIEIVLMHLCEIEIVEQGGISDDVCEWKVFDNSLTDEPQWVYGTTCGKYVEEEHTSKAFAYCPYCGKKIKVVK